MPISPYIEQLRRHIGHDLLLIPAAAILIHDDAGHLLVARQSDFGKWSTIGGAVEPGESPQDAARREAQEETGLDVELTELLDVVGGPDFQITYPNGDRVAYISSVFKGRQVGGTLQPDNDEITELRWVCTDDLDAIDLSPFARTLLQRVGYLRD